MELNEYIDTLKIEFERKSNLRIASKQKSYVRNQFDFYGLRTNERREIQTPFFENEHLPKKSELEMTIKMLWEIPQREFHHFGQELAYKYIHKLEKTDINLFEFMVSHKSWWDTVDFIANKLMGAYFIEYPEQKDRCVERWLESNNIWLKRSSLLFQLKYKENLDTKILSSTINSLLSTNDYFINKAIGWVLREYSRTNPDWVKNFASKTKLSILSEREAIRLLN